MSADSAREPSDSSDVASAVSDATGHDRQTATDVINVLVGLGVADTRKFPGAARGEHITRYVMYRRIAEFFQGERPGGRVLEISGNRGALYRMFDASRVEYFTTNYPEADVSAMPYPTDRFDFVTAASVPAHVRDPRKPI